MKRIVVVVMTVVLMATMIAPASIVDAKVMKEEGYYVLDVKKSTKVKLKGKKLTAKASLWWNYDYFNKDSEDFYKQLHLVEKKIKKSNKLFWIAGNCKYYLEKTSKYKKGPKKGQYKYTYKKMSKKKMQNYIYNYSRKNTNANLMIIVKGGKVRKIMFVPPYTTPW